MSADSVNNLLHLYRIQITKGCGDNQCTKPFCKSNVKRKRQAFGARVFSTTAAKSLASHLVTSLGKTGICGELYKSNHSGSYAIESESSSDCEGQFTVPKSVNSLASQVQSNVFCYQNGPSLDQFKESLQACFGQWINEAISDLTVVQLVDQVRNIDIAPEYVNTILAKLLKHGQSQKHLLRLWLTVKYMQMCAQDCSPSKTLDAMIELMSLCSPGSGPLNFLLPIYTTLSSQAFLSPTQYAAMKSTHQRSISHLPPFSSFFRRNPYFFRKTALQRGLQLFSLNQFQFGSEMSLAMFRYGCLRQMEIAITKSQYIRACFDHFSSLGAMLDSCRVLNLCAGEDFVVDVERHNFLVSVIHRLSVALKTTGLVNRPLRIRFGVGEQLAVDQGGLQIEFFQLFGYEITHSNYGLFLIPRNLAWFNPGFTDSPSIYQFIGMWFGIAVYNGCMIDIQFPLRFYDYLKGEDSLDMVTLEEFTQFDPVVASSMQLLLSMSREALLDLNLEFEFSYRCDSGIVQVLPLPSRSKYHVVTPENVNLYVQEYINCAMIESVRPFMRAFKNGFQYIVSDDILSLISCHELQLMVEGTREISVSDLRLNTTYDGYSEDSPTVQHFWNVIDSFSHARKEQLLEFVTGSKRVPIGGLSKIDFVIQHNGADTSRLPSSSVCFSRLLLPEYNTKEELEKMLLLALNHSRGFGLI